MDTSYESHISSLFGKNVFFENGSAAHGGVVISEIINKAKGEICIYAGNLNGKVSKKYQLPLESSLRNGGKVRILLNDMKNITEEPPLLRALKPYTIAYPNSVQVKHHNKGVYLNNNEIHFTVADDMYRVEVNIEDCTAFGNLGDKVFAKKLKDQFNALFSKAEEVDLFSNYFSKLSSSEKINKEDTIFA